MANPWQYELLKNAEAQSSDSTVFKVDLPKDGHISEIDLTIAATNGATSNAGYSNGGTAGERLEDQIDKIEVIGNNAKTIISVTSLEDLIAEAIRLTGKAPARFITEAASGVQRINVPIYFGRFPNDKDVILPNGAYGNQKKFWDSLRLEVTYSTAIAATSFATGTTTFSVGVKKLVDGSPPESKIIKVLKKKEDYTTLASGDKDFALTYGKDIYYSAVQVYCYEAGIEEGVDFTTLAAKYTEVGRGQVTYLSYPWRLLQERNAAAFGVNELIWEGRALCSDTDVISTRVPSPDDFSAKSELYTLAANLATMPVVESRAGDQLTLGVWHIGDTAAAYTTDQAVYWRAKSQVIPRYAYIQWDEGGNLSDLLNTQDFSDFVLTATNGGAGGTVRINEIYMMPAKAFRTD